MMSTERDELIRRRAYEIWEAAGCPDGCEQEHWRRAEAELDGADDEGLLPSNISTDAHQDGMRRDRHNGSGSASGSPDGML